MKRFVVMVAACLLASSLNGCNSETSSPRLDMLRTGEPFPDVSFVGFDGNKTQLSSYRGKLIVLNLWATWCEPCRREMPHLQQLSDQLDARRFQVIGLAGDDDPHAVREYLIDKGVRFTNYIDPGQETAKNAFGVQIFPYTFLIAPDGKLIQRIPGPREWHQPQVVELLEAAYSGDYSGL